MSPNRPWRRAASAAANARRPCTGSEAGAPHAVHDGSWRELTCESEKYLHTISTWRSCDSRTDSSISAALYTNGQL